MKASTLGMVIASLSQFNNLPIPYKPKKSVSKTPQSEEEIRLAKEKAALKRLRRSKRGW